jgi:hypothetical protein
MYELQIDDGLGGDFISMYNTSHDTAYIFITPIRGLYYRIRY